ncbi:unnamed protein product [Rotaria magnacalcarata]|nr:unnamed protein product [Rotaria magnacalcarata]CAF2122555.1 unnamed protein product [Rotaria magnacalcarata]
MFGRDPKGPLSLLIGERTEEARLTTNLACTNSKTQKSLVNNLRYAYNIVKEHAEIETLKQKVKYDRHTTNRQYAEGDLVWAAITTRQIGKNSIAGKLITNRNKTATENDQTVNERQRITTNNNDGSMDDDLNLQNIKENNPPTCYAPSQRRV